MIKYTIRVYKDRTEWYLDGQLHRVDGPAVEYTNGTKLWCQNGQLHREDGPAVEHADGYKAWYKNDQLHRADGPAAQWADGTKSWYINGKRVTQAAVMKPVKQCIVARIKALLGHKIKVVAG